MFLRKWVYNSKVNCLSILKTEAKKNILKSMVSNKSFNSIQIYFLTYLIHKYGKITSISFFRRFCIVTKNPRSVFRRFKLSRNICKKFASIGVLVGLRKSSF